MEELLKIYLLHYYGEGYYTMDKLKILYYEINGSMCTVDYSFEEYYPQKTNINIWDMLVFLNSDNK